MIAGCRTRQQHNWPLCARPPDVRLGVQQMPVFVASSGNILRLIRDASGKISAESDLPPVALTLKSAVDQPGHNVNTTLLIKRHLLNEVGLQDECLLFAEDWDWLLRIVRVTAVIGLDQPLAQCHVRPCHSAHAKRAIQDIKRLLLKHLPWLLRTRPGCVPFLLSSAAGYLAMQMLSQRRPLRFGWYALCALLLRPSLMCSVANWRRLHYRYRLSR